jgi:hypothetical protein
MFRRTARKKCSQGALSPLQCTSLSTLGSYYGPLRVGDRCPGNHSPKNGLPRTCYGRGMLMEIPAGLYINNHGRRCNCKPVVFNAIENRLLSAGSSIVSKKYCCVLQTSSFSAAPTSPDRRDANSLRTWYPILGSAAVPIAVCATAPLTSSGMTGTYNLKVRG